ncbi:MAG: TAXI family TRAP transporter solute-binding subunit [Clostridiales bacterium]|nr:TAXI family TRAP transporter solute-binding subunit [Clostridiales bacterium]
MKKNRMFIAAVVFVSLLLLLSACGQKPAQPPAQPEPQEQAVPSIEWPNRLSVATGGTGGTYYPYGGGMAKIISEHMPNYTATAEVTGASVENIRLVHSQDAEIALIMGDVGYQSYVGEGRFENDAQDTLIMFQMYPNVYQIVTLQDYDIKGMPDLVGKRVSIGAPGSGTEYKTELVFGSLGITYDDFNVERLSFAEQTDALKDRVIDAGVWSVGPPTASILDLASTHKIHIIPFTDEEIRDVLAANPFYNEYIIPAGMYPGVDVDVKTLAVWNSVIVNRFAPEEEVYQVVKAIFENMQDLLDIHQVAVWTTPENTVQYSTSPLHPGTIRYFEEIGITVPDHLKP